MEHRAIRQLMQSLHKEFDGLVDLADVPRREHDRLQQFRTRALSAMVVRYLRGCSAQDATDCVIDGDDDQDIDAIAYDEDDRRIWLIQTKWSDNGNAKFKEKDTKTFTYGVDLVLNGRHDKFNQRYQRHVAAIESILDNEPRLSFVVALARGEDLHPDHRRVLEDKADSFRIYAGEPADIEILTLPKLHKIALADMNEPALDLRVELLGVVPSEQKPGGYTGIVAATEVARWYSEHGEKLFRRNIRGALRRTAVNQQIAETITHDPNLLWAFNNGITLSVASASIGHNKKGVLRDVSVVNGAQTVWSIAEVARDAPEQLENAAVDIKVVEIGDSETGLVERVTEAANTQNQVQVRDFAVLDEQQEQLRRGFRKFLDLEYVVKRTDDPPPPDKGCTSEEALLALACTHPDPRHAAQAKAQPDVLWDRTGSGSYRQLFRPEISEWELWRRVRLMRVATSCMESQLKKLAGRGELLTRHGQFFVTHVVAQELLDNRVRDEKFDWEQEVLSRCDSVTKDAVKQLIATAESLFPGAYAASTFKNSDACIRLSAAMREAMSRGAPAPGVPDEFLSKPKTKKRSTPNFVNVLVEHGVIADGTPLEFRAQTKPERRVLHGWTDLDPRRSRATWVNDRGSPLIWEVDGKRYSATGLAKQILASAADVDEWRSIRGTLYWHVRAKGSIYELGEQLMKDLQSTSE